MEDLSKNVLEPKSRKILIVDDDEAIRDLLEFIIKKEGFLVVKASDGEEALERVGDSAPHLIILDLMMPRYGGFEVLRRLQGGDGAKIPIVVLTGRYTDRSTAEMIRQESNVKEFLEKPVKPAVLTHLIHKLLRTKPGAGLKAHHQADPNWPAV